MIYTIGHSTRSAEELVELLRGNEVSLLVDVRRYPGSRRHPHFNQDALRNSLGEAGIGYRHAPELGGRRGSESTEGGGSSPSPNRGWRNASFRAYADHMGTREFGEALDRLIQDAETETIAIMCAEAVPWRCHRNLISDALVARRLEVRHITSASKPSAHRINRMAVVDEEGGLTYPGEQGELLS